jgi:hypothetical protein
MTATSNRRYYHEVQDYSLPITNSALITNSAIVNLEALEIEKNILNPLR